MKKFRKSLGNRSGNVMLEFAFGALVLVYCFMWTFQYGYVFYRYNTLLTAVNSGARYASLAPYDSLTSTPSTAFSNAVKNVVVYGNPAGGSTPIVSGLTTSKVDLTVTFTPTSPTTDAPDYMTVSISSFSIPAVFKTITFTTKPKVKYKYQGNFTPAAAGA
jgi:Flp pilus assembly protein TadG